MRIRKRISEILLGVIFFLVPIDLSAEVKQLICKKVTPVPTEEDFKTGSKYWAQNIVDNCSGEEFSETYTVTLDTSLLEDNQSFNVELNHQSCQSPRPYDDGTKQLASTTDELKIFHYGLTYLVINRNDLKWTTDSGLGLKSYNEDKTCEIKDIDTSKRKL